MVPTRPKKGKWQVQALPREKARTSADWLERLGDRTKLVTPRFGVVVHRAPTAGLSLEQHKQ